MTVHIAESKLRTCEWRHTVSSMSGRTHLILSVIMILIGIMVIVNGIAKGESGINTEIAIGVIAIIYGLARYWFFRPR